MVMKAILENEYINLDDERAALVDFVKVKWDGISEGCAEAIAIAFLRGLDAAKYWLSANGIFDAADEFLEWREDPEKWNMKDKRLDEDSIRDLVAERDGVYKVVADLLRGEQTYDRIVKDGWSFGRELKNIKLSVAEKIVGEVKPKGWDKLKSSYKDFDGYDEYIKKFAGEDIALFNGVDSATAGTEGFHCRVSLPATMYGDISQDCRPIDTLLGAAFAHGMFVAQHNNTAEILKELAKIKEKYSSKEYFNEPVSIGQCSDVVSGKIFRAVVLANKARGGELVVEKSVVGRKEIDIKAKKNVLDFLEDAGSTRVFKR
jgi:hypothetical protein